MTAREQMAEDLRLMAANLVDRMVRTGMLGLKHRVLASTVLWVALRAAREAGFRAGIAVGRSINRR